MTIQAQQAKIRLEDLDVGMVLCYREWAGGVEQYAERTITERADAGHDHALSFTLDNGATVWISRYDTLYRYDDGRAFWHRTDAGGFGS